MSHELDPQREPILQAMMNVEVPSVMAEPDLKMRNATRIPLSDLSALGVAFQPLSAAVQTAVNGSGGSGIYFVNTMGKQMFHAGGSTEYIGALKSSTGAVGGGQARMTALACDPTMLFMAAALINIEKKLDTIQQTQEEILQFLEEKGRATLQGNLNVLGDVARNFKYNWKNEKYKTNKHIIVQQIKKEAEASIILYREQIGKRLNKRSLIHSDLEVRSTLKKLQAQFQDYQLALYLFAYSAFLEVMLLGNFSEGYLNNVEQSITDYSYQYRTLYTKCYDLMKDYSKSSVQAGILSGLSAASKFMGNAIAKVPVISKSQLDENLIEAGSLLGTQGEQRAVVALSGLIQTRANVTVPFVENIRVINNLYNKPVQYRIDGDSIYVQQVAD
mgnify:FL=1